MFPVYKQTNYVRVESFDENLHVSSCVQKIESGRVAEPSAALHSQWPANAPVAPSAGLLCFSSEREMLHSNCLRKSR